MGNSLVTIGTRKVGRREFAELSRPVLDPEEIRQITIATARQVLGQEQALGFDKDPRVIVDRRYDAQPTAVRPFGKIEFRERGSLGEIVGWVYQRVVRLSPFKTGQYQNSHLILVNGAVIGTAGGGTALPNLQDIPRDAVVRIVNVTPYARKIEGAKGRRKGGRKPLSSQAPNGVYRAVFKEASRKWGASAFIKYKFVTLAGSSFQYTLKRGGYAEDRTKTYSNALNFFPSIEIRASQGTR